ncbi:hypothetical protein [Marinoscillum sp.]|uniref:hypothetical protein n=1 Tax=Marinoscillum sp. TaxID=2024838 RepID=UPI003BADB9E6
MHKTTLIIGLIGLLVAGCLETNLDATDTFVDNRLTYLQQSFEDLGIPNDPFEVTAITPKSSKSWDVIIEHSGGCESHSFYTWWDESWQSEGQVRFFLIHNSNGDNCEALVRDTLSLDMDEVFSSQLPDTTVIRLVNASSGANISVDPQLAAISQSNSCSLKADIATNTCGDGIWEDRWLHLQDSINEKPVWLIPVRSSANVSLLLPEEQDSYRVGVTLLFGFESSQLSNTCYETDDGYAIPVSVNCIDAD